MLLKTFGNITFSIGTDEFEKTGIRTGDAVRVTFTRDGKVEWQAEMTYQPSFGYVPEGDPVVFNGSSGYMDIGLNRKSFIAECIPQILAAKDRLAAGRTTMAHGLYLNRVFYSDAECRAPMK